MKLFSAAWTWYVAEYGPATGEAFGFVQGFAESGAISTSATSRS